MLRSLYSCQYYIMYEEDGLSSLPYGGLLLCIFPYSISNNDFQSWEEEKKKPQCKKEFQVFCSNLSKKHNIPNLNFLSQNSASKCRFFNFNFLILLDFPILVSKFKCFQNFWTKIRLLE